MATKTGEIIMSTLEENGLTGFRSQAMDTVEYCMPFALVAASIEMDRQEATECPDDTDFRNEVEIITSSNAKLIETYGNFSGQIRNSSIFAIEVQFLNAFPEIFRYGADDYPVFSGSDYHDMHVALETIDLNNIVSIRQHVDQALTSIIGATGEQSERVRSLENELTCIKDWLDVYPAEEIVQLQNK